MSGDLIEREDGKAFLRYDEIQVKDDGHGNITVTLHLEGRWVHRMDINGWLTQGQILTLKGMHGRVELHHVP